MLESSNMNSSRDPNLDEDIKLNRPLDYYGPDNNIDPVTSTNIWKEYFKLKADAIKEYADGMKKVYDKIDKTWQGFREGDSTTVSNRKLEFVYASLRNADRKEYNEVEHDKELCCAIKNELEDYKDAENDDLILHNKALQLTHARKKLIDQIHAVERKKEKYYRSAFKLEKAEIKKEITEKEEDIKKHEKTFRHIQKKVEKRLKKYHKEHAKLANLITIAKEKSNDCKMARTRVDVKRAEFIKEKLEKYCNEAKTRWAEEFQNAQFEMINANELLRNRLPYEYIRSPKTTEKYVGTKNKHELFEQVRKEMAEDRERRQRGEKEEDSSDDDDDDEVKAPNLRARSRRRLAQNETPVVPFNSAVNGGDESPRPGPSGVHAGGSVEPDDGGSPHVKGIGSKYLVTTAYRKKAANEMNLSRGKIIKLIMPPNDKGMAFGEKKGRFGGRKTKGYFPMECVVPAD